MTDVYIHHPNLIVAHLQYNCKTFILLFIINLQDDLGVYFVTNLVYNGSNRKVEVPKMLELEKGYPSVNKTFRIPIHVVEQLERLAGEYNTSVNKIVIQCLEYSLENIAKPESQNT